MIMTREGYGIWKWHLLVMAMDMEGIGKWEREMGKGREDKGREDEHNIVEDLKGGSIYP